MNSEIVISSFGVMDLTAMINCKWSEVFKFIAFACSGVFLPTVDSFLLPVKMQPIFGGDNDLHPFVNEVRVIRWQTIPADETFASSL